MRTRYIICGIYYYCVAMLHFRFISDVRVYFLYVFMILAIDFHSRIYIVT